MEVITRTTIHEAYFDLWGYSWGWCEKIINVVHDYDNIIGGGETSESYKVLDCGVWAVMFQSTDKSRVDKLIKKVNSLLALAQKTYVKQS